ncbi:MAG TPA: nucleotide sugar epimerase [Opitutae bacterium]|nr:nucleotide sugar epimerase [Opitutae bacterium]|tara:strand:+ start:299 stop:1282 length:984 start_codon:yes stop_codon:yes gene_type:complete
MTRCLVTGAAGFIASQVCRQLLEEGHEVVGLDNLNDYYDVSLKEWRLDQLRNSKHASSFDFHKLDLEHAKDLQGIFEEKGPFDVVFNLAARAGVRYSMENPHVYFSTNTIGTLNLLDCMKNNGCGKIVLASTSSLYAGQPMPFSETLPVNEPLSPYAASKKAAELLAFSYHKLYDLDVSVVRYFTVFGPAGRPDMSIFRFIKWIDEEVPIELFGDGSQSRDFTYVDDIASGSLAAMKRVGYEIFNLGGGRNPISLNHIIGSLEELLGKSARINHQPFHIADIKETWAEIDKAERMLGWTPSTSLEDGLMKCVEWYLENKKWVKGIKV